MLFTNRSHNQAQSGSLQKDGSPIGLALPMALIGIGQGFALSPLTIAGIADVAAEDAGAASGLINAAHQLGGSFGLDILVTVFAAAGGPDTLDARHLLAHRLAASLTGSAAMLALSLVVVLASSCAAARWSTPFHPSRTARVCRPEP